MNVNMIIGLVAQTDIHAGASNSGSLVDLPIQREGHTDWPVIAGSGVKGALRSFGEDNMTKNKLMRYLVLIPIMPLSMQVLYLYQTLAWPCYPFAL